MRTDGSSIVGSRAMSSETGQYELASCPSGHDLRTTEEQGSADLQQCFKRQSLSSYIWRPDVDSCQACLPGQVCYDNGRLDSVIL